MFKCESRETCTMLKWRCETIVRFVSVVHSKIILFHGIQMKYLVNSRNGVHESKTQLNGRFIKWNDCEIRSIAFAIRRLYTNIEHDMGLFRWLLLLFFNAKNYAIPYFVSIKFSISQLFSRLFSYPMSHVPCVWILNGLIRMLQHMIIIVIYIKRSTFRVRSDAITYSVNMDCESIWQR